METKKLCKFCKIEFFATKGNQKFCSSSCCKKLWRKNNFIKPILSEKPCNFCKKEFLPSMGNQKFCSSSCRLSHNLKDKKRYLKIYGRTYYLSKKKNNLSKPILSEKPCNFCKKIFIPTRRNQIFCSSSCCLKLWENNNFTKKTFLEKPCNFCKIEFFATKGNQKFCSSSCCLKFWRKNNFTKKTFLEKPCNFCKKIFIPTRRNRRFCSSDCRLSHNLKNKIKDLKTYSRDYYLSKKDNNFTKSIPLKKSCNLCKKEFITTKSNKKFCSSSCCQKLWRKNNLT